MCSSLIEHYEFSLVRCFASLHFKTSGFFCQKAFGPHMLGGADQIPFSYLTVGLSLFREAVCLMTAVKIF